MPKISKRKKEATTKEDSNKKARTGSADSKKAAASSTEVEAKAKPSESPMPPQSAPVKIPPPLHYIGKFDLYSAQLKFLSDVHRPRGVSAAPQYDALYKTILKYQAKPDYTSRLALRSGIDGTTGTFSDRALTNPMSDEPVESTIYVGSESTSPTEVLYAPMQTLHPNGGIVAVQNGISCALELAKNRGSSGSGCFGFSSGSGRVRMHRVWVSEKGEELFEGHFAFQLFHGAMLQRKGHDGPTQLSYPFWAVRARRGKDGEEIGLDAGDGKYLPREASAPSDDGESDNDTDSLSGLGDILDDGNGSIFIDGEWQSKKAWVYWRGRNGKLRR